MSKRNLFFLLFILILTAGSGIFVFPRFWGAKFLPWRLGLDLVGGSHLVYDVNLSNISDRQSVLSGLRDIMEKRVNLFGVSEPNVVQSQSGGKSYIIVELAGIKNPGEAIAQIGRTAFLEFREVLLQGAKGDEKEPTVEFAGTPLGGRYLTAARLTSDSLGQPQVAISFNSEGAKLFEELTGKNVGKPLAIFIDNQLISSPRVNEKISGGNAVITGVNGEEAKALVNLLNAGALPAPVSLISQSTIGASLGAEFLKKAIWAGFWGTLAVILFISAYYRNLGIFASSALVIYIVLTLGVFKVLTITMSLAGIAGFILSIGMAVDANILIFERTKEEIKRGLTRVGAIEEGFRRAWPSIRDSNISTIITSIILYFFTTSFVQGFALTLLLGVLISMFSSITITRTLLRLIIKT
ncbi:MAG: protein translocase subunit SecD [Candidatus Magasanikbacteria bacterium]|nr:protein translocase subunit SecD [Candidatus Magasanikbacteria bacterium]